MNDALLTFVKAEADAGTSPAEIERKMKAATPLEEIEKLPSLRTIRRVVEDRRPQDSTGIWRIKDAEAEDARLILDVLADVIMETEGRKRSFTKKEASWVLQLRKVAPDARPYNVWRLAREYMALESKKIADIAALDHYLAFRPWTNRNRFGNYEGMIALGWITEDPLRLWDTEDRLYSDKELYPHGIPSLAEGHPYVNGVMLQWRRLQQREQREFEEKLSLVKDRDPRMYDEIGKAWEKARRLYVEYLRTTFLKRKKIEVTTEDKKVLESIVEEYKRLLNNAGVQQ